MADREPEHDDGASVSDDESREDGNFGSQEEAEEAVRMIGQTPMLDNVQKMLLEQQKKELKEKELAKKDLEEDLRRAQRERENLGVRLYGLQQQLASIQMKLEESHEKHQDTVRRRADSEQEAKEKKQILSDFNQEVKHAQEKLDQAKQEENSIKQAVKQVEAFLEETRGEIAVMRRATHKTEEAVTDLERKKTEQDMYIDTRVTHISQLQEQIGLIEAQKQSQQVETQAAESTLREASKEMEATVFEKRQVIAQWNSTLIALRKRDEACQSMVTAIKEIQEERRTVISETEGCSKSAQKVQYESEQLTDRKVRQERSLKTTEDAVVTNERAYQKLTERFTLLKHALEQQEAETRKLRGATANVSHELKSTENQVDVVERQRHAAEQEAASLVGDRITATKASKNLARESSAIQKRVHDKEIEVAAVENEKARIRIDKLTTRAHTEKLADELASKVSELKDKDRLIEKYKAEIRQRNDQIEKRAYVVDRLNRKLEKMVSSQDEPEVLGPLEATIKNLGRETAALQQQNRELERHWLRLQTDLVKVVSDMQEEEAKVHELSSTETIMLQKRKRLDNKIASQQVEIKTLDKQVRHLHNDMHKLNELIAEHKGKHEELANTNAVLQADFVAELKELEAKSVETEAQIEKAKMEKQALLDQVMESERQIKLWEKKIQLEKETQQALDPTVGQGEVKAMEKEIHRMRLRHDNLIREQERMIKEMETAILKRETIANRKKGADKGGAKTPASMKKGSNEAIAELTQAELRRKVKAEKKEARRASKQVQEFQKQIAEKLQDSENITMELEKASGIFASVEDAITDKKKAINDAIYRKQKNIEGLNRVQQLSSKYIDFAKNPVLESEVSREEADILMEQSQDQIDSIVETLKKISNNHPHLSEVLDRVTQLFDNA